VLRPRKRSGKRFMLERPELRAAGPRAVVLLLFAGLLTALGCGDRG
jgi:hypothetical protein